MKKASGILRPGPGSALASAVLFGLSPPLAKLILGDSSPIFLAGLLYLGAFIGLELLLLYQGRRLTRELGGLSPGHRLKVAGAVAAGGILAPICLIYAVQRASAFEVSLLLNLETTATTIIAWLVFKEHVGARVWLSQSFVLAGALALTLDSGGGAFSTAGLLAAAACVLWGIDNNLTRDIDEISSTALAALKGIVGGSFNLALAIALGQGAFGLGQAAGGLALGAVCYGLSLVLFIEALRALGSARAAVYFSAAPLFGALASVALLGERPAVVHWWAAGSIAAGLFILSRERHGHAHTHEPLAHRHPHAHDDEHHAHGHQAPHLDAPRHEHHHTHAETTHAHVHWPDTHHRH